MHAYSTQQSAAGLTEEEEGRAGAVLALLHALMFPQTPFLAAGLTEEERGEADKAAELMRQQQGEDDDMGDYKQAAQVSHRLLTGWRD